MNLLKFLEREAEGAYHRILFIALVSGFANAVLLAVVNHASHIIFGKGDLTEHFITYLIAFILFIYTQWYSFYEAISVSENAIFNTRIRLVKKLKQIDLQFIESTGKNKLYSKLTQNSNIISQSIPQITSAAQVTILIIFSLLYLMFISSPSFIVSTIFLFVSIFFLLGQIKSIKKSLQISRHTEQLYFKSISELINGFKEMKINEEKSDSIIEEINKGSENTKAIKITARAKEVKLWGAGRVIIYALMPLVIFIIPIYSKENIEDIFKISATMLFMSGPLTLFVNSLPIFNYLSVAIDEIMELEDEIDTSIGHSSSDRVDQDFSKFKEIKIKKVYFSYAKNKNGSYFESGPLNETFYRGEVVFIIGSNGSGKSTFLKLLTGLYYPNNGYIQVDNKPIDDSNYSSYRALYSTIFIDFHLFDNFYGLENIVEDEVNYWLDKMKMSEKASYSKGAFSTTSLSTGQRKRLALIIAILDNRPVLVLDEFAADQDPKFRKYFYMEIIPELKQMNKLIIAVSHDDNYFHIADRVFSMKNGQLSPFDGEISHVY